MPDPSGASEPVALRLTLPCDLTQVRHAAQDIHRFLAELGCAEEVLMACDLALVEACNNAVKYAPEKVRHLPVIVDVLCQADEIELRVTDHTEGFDWPKYVQLPDPESESGRGLYLIHSLMDSAMYLRGQEENVLVLRKKLATPGLKILRQSAPEKEKLITGLLDELSWCYESLSAIFRYGAEQSKINDLNEFSLYLLTDLLHIVGAEWFVFRAAREDIELSVMVASEPTLELQSISLKPAGETIESIELEAAVSRRLTWFDEQRPPKPADPLRIKIGSCGFVHPVFIADSLVGTLTLGKKAPGQKAEMAFTASQLNIVATFAHFLAIQLINSRFQEEHVMHRIISREIEIAGSIQESLLLKRLPDLPGLQLAAFCQSAHQVGGDFYDVLKISDDTALLVIADVMGKGVLAAMFAAIFRTVLRASPELTHQPAALLTRVNQLLFEELSGVDMFITAQLAYVDAKNRKLITASAGHCPLLVALGNGTGVKSFSPEGMPLGILPDTVFADQVVELPQNCRVLLYTDGLTEAVNAEGERYGQERLVKWLELAGAGSATAKELKEQLAESLGEFQTKTALNDDQTFLIMTG